jgi:hypothetical protein
MALVQISHRRDKTNALTIVAKTAKSGLQLSIAAISSHIYCIPEVRNDNAKPAKQHGF